MRGCMRGCVNAGRECHGREGRGRGFGARGKGTCGYVFRFMRISGCALGVRPGDIKIAVR